MSSGEGLQRELARAFFVAAPQMAGSLPYRRLDEFEWDFTAGENSLKRAGSAAVLEAAGSALLGHRLGALDPGAIGAVRLNPGTQREHVDTFLRTGADG